MMMIFILGLLYAIFMISAGINEIYLHSTGQTAFLSCLLLTATASLLLVAFVWQCSVKTKR
jgi:hypothetical protein